MNFFPQKTNLDRSIQSAVDNIAKEPQNPLFREDLRKLAEKDPAKVLISIMRNAESAYNRDLSHWKSAQRQARDPHNPRRADLMYFYRDLAQDPFINGIVYNRRIIKLSNREFKIVNNADEGEVIDKTNLLKKQWFVDFIKYAMESRFFGFSLVYFNEWEKGMIKKIKLVYRENVHPEFNLILTHPYSSQGYDYTHPDYTSYVLPIGNDEDLGIFEKAAIPYILKKHSWMNWDEFEEKFGIPISIIKTVSQDKKVLDQLDQWMRKLGSAKHGVFPADTTLDIKEGNRPDAFQVFYEKLKQLNFELEVLFTGQNRVTQSGGSLAKEEEMAKQDLEILEDDKIFIRNLVNDNLLPLLISNGYPFKPEDRFEWDDAEQVTIIQRSELFDKVNNWGFQLDQEQISKEFNIKIVGQKEKKAEPPPPENLPAGSQALIKYINQIHSFYHQ